MQCSDYAAGRLCWLFHMARSGFLTRWLTRCFKEREHSKNIHFEAFAIKEYEVFTCVSAFNVKELKAMDTTTAITYITQN